MNSANRTYLKNIYNIIIIYGNKESRNQRIYDNNRYIIWQIRSKI